MKESLIRTANSWFFSKFNLVLERKWLSDYWTKQQYLEKGEFKYVLWLHDVYQKIATVPGHIVELGVAYGRNTILFSHLMRMHNEEDIRKYIGFDTFDGFTTASLEEDAHLSGKKWKNISVDAIHKRVQKAGDFKNYELIKGDLLQTLPAFLEQNPGFRAALLYVDCNAYEPSLRGMEILKDFMTPGGIICIDEKQQGGETKALVEFCQKNNLVVMKDNSPVSIPAYTKIPLNLS